MKKQKHINQLRDRRAHRVRTMIRGTAERPRLSIFRSNKNISAQLINDSTGKTVVSATSGALKTKGNKTAQAKEVGMFIAAGAKKEKITKAVADRGSYRYHGRVKALIEGAREGGLTI